MKSELVIHTVKTGKDRVVFTTSDHIEAPNWTPDGAALIYNGGGRLYRLALDNPKPQEIDLGSHKKLNNDHGISPDGQTIVFSDKIADGNSCIYTVPVSGGVPVRITSNTPGQWIWFNSDKTGSAQLWRMHQDGSKLEQMTQDARVNWFPHPSPDGGMLVYLSYPTGILGHPGDLDVELRLMSPEGGAPRTIVELFGGQGTINVPSWSPDSRQFAYCRYTKDAT